MSVPHLGRGPMPPTQLLKAAFGDNWFYILYFQEPGVAEAEFEADIPKTMRTILAGVAGFDTAAEAVQAKKKGDKFLTGISAPKTLPDWLTEDDVDYFAKEFAGSGFRGGLNRYRNMDRDWEELPELADRQDRTARAVHHRRERPGPRFRPSGRHEGERARASRSRDIPGAGTGCSKRRPPR